MNTLLTTLTNAIDIVMVNTTLPANIGSAARAMHTMGFSNLVLVKPKFPIDDTSMAHAAGATALLDRAKTTSTLSDALQNSQLVFAASSRHRHLPRPVINPKQAAILIEQFLFGQIFTNSIAFNSLTTNSINNRQTTPPQMNAAKVSILFGREDRGLTNDELAMADYHIQIDANPNYPVLNVAAAVQVITSFIYSHFVQLSNQLNINTTDATNNEPINKPNNKLNNELLHHIRQQWDEPAINKQQQQHLQTQLIKLMIELDLANADDLRLLPNRLNRLLARLQLDMKEHQLLQSLINTLRTKISQ